MLKQITVFLENKKGRMEGVTGCLASERINLHALSIADTTDFGILRLITGEPEKSAAVLKEKGYMVKTNNVVAVAVGHNPGSLHEIITKLRELDISIEYMYSLTSRHKKHDVVVVFRFDNQDGIEEKLSKSGITVLGDGLLEELG